MPRSASSAKPKAAPDQPASKNSWAPIVAALASALLLLLAFPPINLFLLSFVGLVPLLRALKAPAVRPARLGVVFGLIYFAGQMFWLLPFVGRWTGSYALAAVPWLLSASLLMPWMVLACWATARIYRQGKTLWLIPLIWAGLEFLRSSLPVIGFPYAQFAMPLANLPQLIQMSALGTITFVSVWVVLANVAVAELMDKTEGRVATLMGTLFVVFGLLSFGRYLQSPSNTSTTVVSIGQLGTDLAFGDPTTEPARIAAAVDQLDLFASGHGSRFLVLPEGLGRADASAPQWPFRPPQMPVIFGMQRGSGPVYQSVFSFDGRWQFVDKTRLVIFGEFVPLRDQLPFLQNFNLPSGDLRPGDRVGTIDLQGIRVGPVVCFEAMFSEVALAQAAQGARLLTVHSIDDWFMGTAMPESLLHASIFRAAENGLPVLRSASLGLTGWIDARGNVRALAPVGETVVMRAEVPVPTGSDALPWRGAFPFAALLLAAIGLAWPAKQRQQESKPS